MSVDLLNKADTLTETCGISGLALLLLIKLAWKAESDGTFRYPEVTYKHCKKSFAKTSYYRVKEELEQAGLLQDGCINVEKLCSMAEAENPKKPPRSKHEQKQQSQIGTNESKWESQIGTSEFQIGTGESQIGTNPPQNLGDNQTPDKKPSIDQIDPASSLRSGPKVPHSQAHAGEGDLALTGSLSKEAPQEESNCGPLLARLEFTPQEQKRVGKQQILDIVDFSRLIEISPEKWAPYFHNAKDMRLVIELWNKAVTRSFPGKDIVQAVEIEKRGSRWNDNEGRFVPSIENFLNRDMALQTLRSHVFCNYKKTTLAQREAARKAEEALWRKREQDRLRNLEEEAQRIEGMEDCAEEDISQLAELAPPPPPPPPPLDPDVLKQLMEGFAQIYHLKTVDHRIIESQLLKLKEKKCLLEQVKEIFDRCMASDEWKSTPARRPSWSSFFELIESVLKTPNPPPHVCPQYDIVYRIAASVMAEVKHAETIEAEQGPTETVAIVSSSQHAPTGASSVSAPKPLEPPLTPVLVCEDKSSSLPEDASETPVGEFAMLAGVTLGQSSANNLVLQNNIKLHRKALAMLCTEASGS